MARAKRWPEVKRGVVRRLESLPRHEIEALRDRLWDYLNHREFMGGCSMESIAMQQPSRNTVAKVENAVRREAGRRRAA
jgi:hypothetical protein